MNQLILTTLFLLAFLSTTLNAQQISSDAYNTDIIHEDFDTEGKYFKIVTNIDNYNYVYDNNTKSYPYTFIHNINNCCNLLSTPPFNALYKENLLYAKYNNIYISRIHHKGDRINKFQLIEDFNTPSTVRLLSVTLKVNNKTINMDIDTNHMYVNNELFSRGFVTRYIKYNNIDINCTDDYIINIMDNDINMVALKSKQYLVINKSDYVVKTVNDDK